MDQAPASALGRCRHRLCRSSQPLGPMWDAPVDIRAQVVCCWCCGTRGSGWCPAPPARWGRSPCRWSRSERPVVCSATLLNWFEIMVWGPGFGWLGFNNACSLVWIDFGGRINGAVWSGHWGQTWLVWDSYGSVHRPLAPLGITHGKNAAELGILN